MMHARTCNWLLRLFITEAFYDTPILLSGGKSTYIWTIDLIKVRKTFAI